MARATFGKIFAGPGVGNSFGANGIVAAVSSAARIAPSSKSSFFYMMDATGTSIRRTNGDDTSDRFITDIG